MSLARRSRIPEILDGVNFTPGELARNLADIRLYNDWTGWTRLILRLLEGLAGDLRPGAPLDLLDVGAGCGDLSASAARWARRRGLRPRVVATDLRKEFLRPATEPSRGEQGRPGAGRRIDRGNGAAEAGGTAPAGGILRCAADARTLPFPDRSFDAAFCSLLIHHLEEPAIEGALGEMRRVTRRGFLVADLRRSRLAYSVVWAVTRLTSRNRLTLHDGPQSVARAFTVAELRALAARSGLPERNGRPGSAGFEVHPVGPARLALVFRQAGRL